MAMPLALATAAAIAVAMVLNGRQGSAVGVAKDLDKPMVYSSDMWRPFFRV